MKQPPQYELYDLKKDPFEFRNLADDPAYAEQRGELAEALKEWQRKTNDPMSNPDNARKLFEMILGAKLERKKLPYEELMGMSLR